MKQSHYAITTLVYMYMRDQLLYLSLLTGQWEKSDRWGDTLVPLCCLSRNGTGQATWERGMKLGKLIWKAVFANSFKYLQMGHQYQEMSPCYQTVNE